MEESVKTLVLVDAKDVIQLAKAVVMILVNLHVGALVTLAVTKLVKATVIIHVTLHVVMIAY